MKSKNAMIVHRRCDVPMARKKKLLPCSHRCKTCIACIERDENGIESHVYPWRGGDPQLQIRNMIRRRYYGI